MTFVHGKETRVFLDKFEVSDFLQEVTTTAAIDTPETSTFGVDDKQYVAGLLDGSASIGGFFEQATDIDPSGSTENFDNYMQSLLGSDTASALTSVLGGTPDTGSRVRMISGRITNYEIGASIGDVVAASVEMAGESASARSGYLLESPDTTFATGTTNVASVDSGAGTANGAVAHLHIWTSSTDGTVDVKIEDSANNADWADLITFTQVAAGTLAYEIGEVTGTVDQYLRMTVTVGGSTGTCKIVCGISRR